MVAKEGKAAKQKKPFNLAKWAKSREGQKTIIIIAFITIPLLLLLVFTYLPFAEMVKFSFYKMKYATPVEKRVFVGWKNYIDVFKRDASCEEVAREVLLDNAGVYEGENEAVSIYLFCGNLDPTTFSTGTFFHARFTRSFTEAIRAFVSRADTKVLLQLRKELRKMDLTFFLSHKMMKDYFEKYCPTLNSILSKWKLVRELEEAARDGRV